MTVIFYVQMPAQPTPYSILRVMYRIDGVMDITGELAFLIDMASIDGLWNFNRTRYSGATAKIKISNT